ncbi:MAG: hypothetical protein CL479_05370 [Acidobacteria bacterium]|nr:hypothetical protein [Acidobacteriota bacterium]
MMVHGAIFPILLISYLALAGTALVCIEPASAAERYVVFTAESRGEAPTPTVGPSEGVNLQKGQCQGCQTQYLLGFS